MRLHTKFLLAAISLFVLTMAFMLYFSIRLQSAIVGRVLSDMNALTQTVRFSSQRLATINNADRDTLERFIQDATKNRKVGEVLVVNSSQHVIASSNPKKVGTNKKVLDHETIVKEDIGTTDSVPFHKHYSVSVPIIRDGATIGMVQTTISLHDYNHFLEEAIQKAMIATAVLFLILLVLSILVMRHLGKPLDRLVEAAGHVADGQLDVELPPIGRDEVGRLTAAFNDMAKRLRDQRLMEDHLSEIERRAILAETASVISHEIRNPLNMINLTADYLASSFTDAIVPDRQEAFRNHIADLKTQVRQLNHMAQEFVEAGRPVKPKRELVPLADLLQRTEALIRLQFSNKKIGLVYKCDEDIVLNVDNAQFGLVLLNLLLNASNAMPEGGSVEIVAEVENGFSTIRVSDTGSGIRKDIIEKIFEPYVTGREGGTGLGLALVRRIVEAHGGTISAANSETGAVFTIRIPQE